MSLVEGKGTINLLLVTNEDTHRLQQLVHTKQQHYTQGARQIKKSHLFVFANFLPKILFCRDGVFRSKRSGGALKGEDCGPETKAIHDFREYTENHLISCVDKSPC